jgi:hypothetical protein
MMCSGSDYWEWLNQAVAACPGKVQSNNRDTFDGVFNLMNATIYCSVT